MSWLVEVSAQAQRDMRDIYSYIADTLQAGQSAANLLTLLEQAVLSLDQMPERCHLYKREPWRSRGLRVLPVKNYCIFYIPDCAKQTVSVLRVLYGGRDIESALALHNETDV